MRFRDAIFVFSVLTTAALRAVTGLDAENEVRRQLRTQGVQVGFNAVGDAYTVVASACRTFDGKMFGSARTVCFRMAELRARHQIMNALGLTASGATTVRHRAEDGDGRREKTVSTVFSAFSEHELRGCDILAFHECAGEGKYAVGVALRWRREAERREKMTDEGMVSPAADWAVAFERWLDDSGWELPPPCLVFLDGNGFLHRIGTGVGEPAGDDPAWKRAALGLATLFAGRNLQLAIYGNDVVRRTAAARMTAGTSASSSSAYEALASAAATGTFPPGTRELRVRSARDPVTGRRVLVAVRGY